jgi:sulfite reductase alpha subunit-like flavoprotein
VSVEEPPGAKGVLTVRIEYVHASKFGNGAAVAEEFRRVMAARGVEVEVHHVREADPRSMAPADLYVFSSPGRMGKPTRAVRRFLKTVRMPEGARYALLTTEMQPRPDKKTGRMPTEEEICRYQKVRPTMHELLGDRGFQSSGEECVYVTDLKGPLEEGWQHKVAAFADRVRPEERVQR